MTVLIVDAANVVGSVPDGWWRYRRALRDLGEEIILVVEGAARGVASVPGVRMDEAPGSGDDRIVEPAVAHAGRGCVVVTADRELRERVRAYGAECAGPRSVRPQE